MAAKSNFQDTINKFRDDIVKGKLTFSSILPTETSNDLNVSRPTIAKIYNELQNEGLVKKKLGLGTTVVYSKDKKHHTFGLLLSGPGESEIFGITKKDI